MVRILFIVFLCLLVPGLASMGYSLWQGPAAWSVDTDVFWGLPISLFVFWIGLAHAGTLISAIFLVLDVKMERRTSILAELATLCALVVAAIFPLMHLGVIENFYMVAPYMDSRGSMANVCSPLVWDFCCILAYGFLSVVYLIVHMLSEKSAVAASIHRPLAWLLFPMVLWVHTVVSLDFAATFVPAWRGAFFPIYFIVGAVFSGLAMVNIMLCGEGYRMRQLEKLMLVGSWFLGAFLLWDWALKGDLNVVVLIFAVLLPQFWFVSAVRESTLGRVLVASSVLVGMLLERVFLVFPTGGSGIGWVDLGLICFGFGLFGVIFLVARLKLSRLIEGEEVLMGEVEESAPKRPATVKFAYFPPLTTPEFRALRFPLLLGILSCVLFLVWVVGCLEENGIAFSDVNLIPLTCPIVTAVAGFVLCLRPLVFHIGKVGGIVMVALAVLLGVLAGMVYGGVMSVPSGSVVSSTGDMFDVNALPDSASTLDSVAVIRTKAVFEARCAGCHGADGRLNEKFVREYYPVPQDLDLARMDALGEDSLVNVVLNGRTNMNPYAGRISPQMARGLVRYMRLLAESARADGVRAKAGEGGGE
ncbi:NrfD/PsrC family molybdoenzyme membrane anchor subunit [uncultured Fibrobacter sp.]|uniref:NrfD/PsrC family molybdoenzyme membrane anchor subunit n=1 Tax=uncultured Fibrobacter sp. TaxID=261512 RepID=UPI0025F8E2C0|nr:NrfD/PsrC family molybdoenzyme membrane anchor subunit [uncultured Fibrobacter sp.]